MKTEPEGFQSDTWESKKRLKVINSIFQRRKSTFRVILFGGVSGFLFLWSGYFSGNNEAPLWIAALLIFLGCVVLSLSARQVVINYGKSALVSNLSAIIVLLATLFLLGADLWFKYRPMPERLTLGIEAFQVAGSYAGGQKVGGLSWRGHDIPVRILITTEDREVRNLDMKLVLDGGTTSIRDIGQINPVSEFKVTPTGDFGLGPNRVVMSGPIQLYGSNTDVPTQNIEPERENTIAPTWRIFAKNIPPNSTEILLLAASRFGKPDSFDGKIRTVDFKGTLEITSRSSNKTTEFEGGVLVNQR